MNKVALKTSSDQKTKSMHNSNRKFNGIVIVRPDYRKGESIEVMESCLFTNIIVARLRKMPLKHFITKIEIIGIQNSLDLQVCEHGIRHRGSALHDALELIEKSVKFN